MPLARRNGGRKNVVIRVQYSKARGRSVRLNRTAAYCNSVSKMIERNECERPSNRPDLDSDVLRRNKSINGPTNHPTLQLNVHRKTDIATVNRAHSDAAFGLSTITVL
jgi:hypothetical protein